MLQIVVNNATMHGEKQDFTHINPLCFLCVFLGGFLHGDSHGK